MAETERQLPAVEFTLYRLPGVRYGNDPAPAHQRIASVQVWDFDPAGPHRFYEVEFRQILAGSAAAYYRLRWDVAPVADPLPGWVALRARLMVDSWMVDEMKPLTFYVGEASDFPTGLARFHETHGAPDPLGGPPLEPAVWAVGARRMQ